MKKIAIIGASYLQRPLVEKAKEMGLYVLCFAWKDGAVCDSISDEFFPISIVEKDEILKICQGKNIDGVCTVASDVAAPTVAYIAEKMGLEGNSYEAALNANNKFLMREILSKASIPCPQYVMITDESQIQDLKFQYPLIVKPSDRSGSLGVSKVVNEKEMADAVKIALQYSFKHQAMVEEYVEGREISVEFISYKGKHYPLQITDKVTTGAPHFVELEHHQPASLSKEMFDKIYSLTDNALTSLGLTNGASHSEYRITDDGRIVVMEIGGRMGGDFIGTDLVRLSTGYDFVKGVIEVALGTFEKPVLSENNCSGVYFLCKETPEVLKYIENKEKYPQIVAAEITENELKNVTCSAERSGYFMYKSDKRFGIG